MMAIFDILIYVAFAFFASWLAKKSWAYVGTNELRERSWDKYLILFMLFFAVIGGIRWDVGNDNVSYALMFDDPPNFDYDKEALWAWFVNFSHSIGLHWSIALGICAFMQIFFIVKALKPYRWILVFLPFLLFGGRYWLDSMNAIRQMLVASAYLWAANFIVNRQFIVSKQLIYYLIFIFVASLIHQSAILLLPFYFLPLNKSLVDFRYSLIIILILCFLLGLTPAFSWLTQYVEFISDATNYDHYSELITERLQSVRTEEALKFGPMMLTYLLIPIFIIWFGPSLKEKFGHIVPQFNVWYNLAYFYACGYFLVSNISHLFIRPMMYFELFQMVMASILLFYLWGEYKKYNRNFWPLIIYCIVIFTNTSWNVYKNVGPFRETVTYKIFLFHKSELEIFNL